MDRKIQEVDQIRNQPISVEVTDQWVIVAIRDGRIVSIPTTWFEWLVNATPEQRANVEILGWMIHWNDLDQGISSEVILLGKQGS